MREASVILKAIREEVFVEVQGVFGRKLGLRKETICRLESGNPKHRLSFRHLESLRLLRPPRHKVEAFEALLQEFEGALRREGEDGGVEPCPDEEGRRAQETQEREEAVRHIEELVRDTERTFQTAKEWGMQQVARVEDTLRQVQASVLDAESQLRAWWAEEMKQLRARGDAEAAQARARQAQLSREWGALAKGAAGAARVAHESAERAQFALAQALKLRRWTAGAAAAALLLGPVSTALMQYAETHHAPQETGSAALTQKQEGKHEENASEGERAPPEQPRDDALSGSLDGGTALAEALRQALPLPANGVPGQLPEPCPRSYEPISGYCWHRDALSAEEVNDGACERLQLYEPSPGWCRAHRAGYHPVLGAHKKNNAVDPQ